MAIGQPIAVFQDKKLNEPYPSTGAAGSSDVGVSSRFKP